MQAAKGAALELQAPSTSSTSDATDIPRQLKSVNLDFSDVCYSIHSKSVGATVDIIKHVSGSCRSGRLMALMGHSGAGKTTLLDILAGTIRRGNLTGRVLVNGRPMQPTHFRKLNCYILQRDVLLATATVREALITAALLTLPQNLPYRTKAAAVDQILQELDLTGCASTLIGDDTRGIKGISGGERRRLSVGIGLVTNPRIIFLDEPTSGLDSENAVSLISCLKQLAGGNRTVVCTIHQPSSDITDMFDDLLLLAQGHVVYHGQWARAVDYFASLGFQCPTYKNPADYYMSITKNTESATQLIAAHQHECTAILAHDGSRTLGLKGDHEEGLAPAAPQCEFGGDISPTTNCWWYQVWILSIRFCRTWYRDQALLASMVGQYVFCSIFIGLIYLQLGHTNKTSSVFDRLASLWLLLAVLAFTPCETACTLWDSERLLLRKEITSGTYSVSTFYLAKTLTTIPFQMACTTLYDVIIYFLIGYQQLFGKFFHFWVITNQFQLISETIGLLCAVVTPSSTYAIIVASALLLVLLSFTGFLVTQTPVYFIWISKISYLSFAFTGLYRNEMTGLLLPVRLRGQKTQLEPVQGSNIPTFGHTFIGVQGGNSYSVDENIACLFAILVGCRILLWVMLKVVAKIRLL